MKPKENYRPIETRDEVEKLLRTMLNEWRTGVGPAGQIIMRPVVRLRNQMEEVDKKLLDF